MDNSIGARVRAVRKYYNLTGAKFGEKLGLSLSAVRNIEFAKLKHVPDNSIRLICAVYGADYTWIMTGNGKMFGECSSSNPVLDRISAILKGNNTTAKATITAISNFSDDDWNNVHRFFDSDWSIIQKYIDGMMSKK